jgi:ABC-type molybdenum transport system ATPase subunit/photorepair protein PhrA
MEEYLIRIEKADVVLEGKKVLHRISWELKPGEHWAVTCCPAGDLLLDEVCDGVDSSSRENILALLESCRLLS